MPLDETTERVAEAIYEAHLEACPSPRLWSGQSGDDYQNSLPFIGLPLQVQHVYRGLAKNALRAAFMPGKVALEGHDQVASAGSSTMEA